MGHLVFSVVVNVLGHVCIQKFNGSGVGWTSTSSGDFAVGNSPELVVLLPELGFENFTGGQETQDSHISHGSDATARPGFCRRYQQRGDGQGRTGYPQALEGASAL